MFAWLLGDTKQQGTNNQSTRFGTPHSIYYNGRHKVLNPLSGCENLNF